MPTNNLAPKSKNYLSSIPPNMAERFGSAVSPYLQGVQELFPPTNPYGQALSNFLLGQAPQAAQRMAEGYPNVLFDTRNPLGGNRIVNPVALDMAAALPVATALKGAGLAKGGVAATFAGARAKTANKEALAVAEKMKALGAPDEEIHKATGWFFGSADGKPRFEIDDSAAQLTDAAKLVFTPGTLQLGRGKYQFDASAPDLMPHPELEAAYPFYKNIGVKSTSDFNGGSYSQSPTIYANDGQSRLIKISQSGDDARSTAFHELQHAIQQREGFARGGSPDYQLGIEADRFYPEWLGRGDVHELMQKGMTRDEVIKAFNGLPEQKDAGRFYDDFSKGGTFEGMDWAGIQRNIKHWKEQQNPEEQYRRLAGEAEARLTQSRMDMTGAERAASYPPGMYDVPVSDQIVRYGEGPALATTPKKAASPESQAIVRADRAAELAADALRVEAQLRAVSAPVSAKAALALEKQKANWEAQIKQSQIDETANKELAQRAADNYSKNGMGKIFNNDQLDAIKQYRLAGDRHGAAAEGTAQAVNSIKTHLESLGIPIRHVSEKGGGISVYADVDGSTVRISDHELPLTPQRLNDRQNGLFGKWDKEIIPTDWSTVSMDDYLAQILERNGQAMSPESQAIARYREIKGPKSVVRMEAALRTAGVPLPKNEPVAYIQRLVDRAHRRN